MNQVAQAMVRQHILFTIGYQGKTIQEFVNTLVEAGITVLCDVRRRPLSRKKGFSKSGLSKHLTAAGITYLHVPELGMPVDLLKFRNANSNDPILREYRARISQVTEFVDTVAAQANDERLCLLCFERDYKQCHRGVLADYMHQSFSLSVQHL